MMNKIVFIFLFITGFYGCVSKVTHPTHKKVRTLILNSQKCENKIDISNLLDRELEIIPLETKEEVLVMADAQKLLTDNYIFIADRISKKIFLFNRQGKFIRNIGKKGRAPGEYIRLGQFRFWNDSLFVQDAEQDKIIIYSVDNNDFREISINPPVYYSDFVIQDSSIYFITNYCNDYNLISLNLKDYRNCYYLPYKHEVKQQKSYWGLTKYSGQNKDTTLLIFSNNDTIYNLTDGKVFPQYVFNFPHNKIPLEWLTKKGNQILRESLKKNYICGVDEIYNAHNCIIGNFGKGNRNYKFIYTKNDDNIRITEALMLNDYGKLDVINLDVNPKGELFFMYDAFFLMKSWEYILSKNEFQSEQVKNLMQNMVKQLKEDDNPVLFVVKLK